MDTPDSPDLEIRLRAVEARLDALEAGTVATPSAPAAETGQAWLIDELTRRTDSVDAPDGSVIFAGRVTAAGQDWMYQWQRPAHVLLDEAWDENLDRLAALAHPVRGAILRRLLNAPATAAELVDEGIVSSTGTAYHHLNALQSGGWTAKDGRGHHAVRPARVVPLLTIIAAGEAH